MFPWQRAGRLLRRAMPVAALLTLVAWQPSRATPVEIRMGVGEGSSEQLFLIKARPDLTPNQGSAYSYTTPTFRGPERITALVAGQLDAVAISTTAALFAASKGIPMKVVARISRDSASAFATSYLALADSAIDLSTLKGKTFGVNGFRQAFDLYPRVAIKRAGLDPDRDVKWLLVGAPQMGDALRSHQIDIGVFVPFYAKDQFLQGGVKTVFTGVSITGIEEEFDVAFSDDFIAKHADTLRAFLKDFVAVTRYYIDHTRDARQSLIDAKMVQIDPKTYLGMTAKDDTLRTPDSKPNVETFAKLQQLMLEMSYIEKPIEVGKLVDTSFLP